MGACASKFSVLKTAAADAPPPAKEEVVVDESKPQSFGHFFKEVKSKGSAESNGEAYGNLKSSESVADAPAKDDLQKEAETDCTKPESLEDKKAENVEICGGADKKIEEQKPTAGAEKKHEEEKPAVTVELVTDAQQKKKEAAKSTETVKIEMLEKKEEEKPAETRELQTVEMDVGKKKDEEEKSTETIKVETLEKKPETPEMDKTEKAEEKLADNTKIETSDKHVLEPTEMEVPSDNKRDEEKSVEKHETPEKEPASDAEKPKAEEHK